MAEPSTSNSRASSTSYVSSALSGSNSEFDVVSHDPPVDLELRKVITVMLHSRGISATGEVLDSLTDLTISNLHDVTSLLKKFVEFQRRRRPSFSDLNLCLRTKEIRPYMLAEQYVNSKMVRHKYKGQLAKVENNVEIILNSSKDTNANEESLFFTSNEYEISQLVTKHKQRPRYVPSYLPDFPPDYTYQNTSYYTESASEKDLRMKLVYESRLTEKSLYALVENDQRKKQEDFESKLKDVSSDESIMSHRERDAESPVSEEDIEKDKLRPDDKPEETKDKSEEGKAEDKPEEQNDKPVEEKNANIEGPVVEKPLDQHKAADFVFDFVEYAKNRAQIRERKAMANEKKRRLRDENPFMKAEKLYSPYAKSLPTEQDNQYFESLIEDEFRSTIVSVRAAEKEKKKKIELILKDRPDKTELHPHEQFDFNLERSHPFDLESEEEVGPQFESDDMEDVIAEELRGEADDEGEEGEKEVGNEIRNEHDGERERESEDAITHVQSEEQIEERNEDDELDIDLEDV